MRRGDVILVAGGEGYTGKPRPAVIVQNDLFAGMDSVTMCPITSVIRDDVEAIRVNVAWNKHSGLQKASQVMVDKVTTIPVKRVGRVIGRVHQDELEEIGDALRLWLELEAP